MDQSLVFHKSSKGLEEIETRKHRLSPALRMVLILVDGKSDVIGIQKKAPGLSQLKEYLQSLQDQGFIDTGAEAEAEVAHSQVAAITQAKWSIVEVVREAVGPELEARATARFMEVDDTVEALSSALDECYEYVSLTAGADKAEIIKQTGEQILSMI